MNALIFLLLALVPGLASAENLFEPVSTDKAMTLLAAMFGKLGIFGASSSDAFSAVLGNFNGAVLAIGGILAAYTILAGTLGTAHDGEMLGKKFSSVWVPIRTALGTALVLPTLSGGYCLMQLIVGWLIVQGIGLADSVWGTYMSANNIQNITTVGMQKASVNALAWNVFSSEACMRGYQKLYEDGQVNSPGIWPPITWGVTTTTTPTGVILEFGAKTELMGFFKNSCGTVTVDRQDPLPLGIGMGEISMMGDLSGLNAELSAADAFNLAAVQNLVKSIDNTARSFASNTSFDVASEINVGAATYEATTRQAAASIVAKLGDFAQLEKSAKKDGFLLAGAWFMRLSYLSEVAQKAVAKTPSATGGAGSVNSTFRDQYLSTYVKPLLQLRESSDMEFGVASSESQSSSAESGGSGLWDWIKSGFSMDKIIKKIFKADQMAATNSDAHPIMEMKRVGNWAGIAAGAMYLKYGSALAAVGNLQGAGTSIAIATLPIAMLVFPALMAVCFTLSYVLPMMPFLIWIGVCLGWLVLCVEALIAAPMWAVMHLHPHGDDLTGTGGQGYRLVLSLTLRPVLMVFGLIAALTLITVFGKLINMVFFDVFMLSQQDSNIFIWLVGLLAAPLIYMGLMFTVIKKCMDAIHIIPDQLLQWFGGAGQQMGHYGDSLGGGQSGTYLASAAVGGMAGRGLGAKKDAVDLQQQIGQRQAALDGNKQAVSAQQSSLKSGFDEKSGSGSAAIIQKALGQGGGKADFGSLEAQQMGSKLDGAVQALGGKDSSLGQQFTEKMNGDLDSGKGFSESFSENLRSGMDEKYGAGAGDFVNHASAGTFQGANMTKSVEQLDAIGANYQAKGFQGSEIAQKTSTLLSAAAKNFERSTGSVRNGGEHNINHYVDKAIERSLNSVSKKV